MSQTEFVQVTFEEISGSGGISEEDWNQSVKGNLQLAEEEAKSSKQSNRPDFLKWEGQEEKVLFFPPVDHEGNINAGKALYKAYLPELDGKNKNITHETLEQFDDDEVFQNRKDKNIKPRLRYYVYVVELTPQGHSPHTYDMAKTRYELIYGNYLTPEQRVLKVKQNKDPKKDPIIKYPTQAEIKALLAKK